MAIIPVNFPDDEVAWIQTALAELYPTVPTTEYQTRLAKHMRNLCKRSIREKLMAKRQADRAALENEQRNEENAVVPIEQDDEIEYPV